MLGYSSCGPINLYIKSRRLITFLCLSNFCVVRLGPLSSAFFSVQTRHITLMCQLRSTGEPLNGAGVKEGWGVEGFGETSQNGATHVKSYSGMLAIGRSQHATRWLSYTSFLLTLPMAIRHAISLLAATVHISFLLIFEFIIRGTVISSCNDLYSWFSCLLPRTTKLISGRASNSVPTARFAVVWCDRIYDLTQRKWTLLATCSESKKNCPKLVELSWVGS